MGLNWIQYEKGILFHDIEFAHNDLLQLGRFKEAEIQRKRVLQAATGKIGLGQEVLARGGGCDNMP